MQNRFVLTPAPSRDMSVARNTRGAAHRPRRPAPRLNAERQQFAQMLESYRNHGGLARVQEVLALFQRSGGPDVATFARWIVQRDVICFEWQDQTWFPWFQLNRLDMAPHPRLGLVFAELAPVYDHWELAYWFAQPNPWLVDCTPVQTLASDLSAVLYAARADRFIANG